MLEIFYPNERAESSLKIDYISFLKKGYKGIIFDIDNTLVPHGEPADEKIIELFQKLHTMGFSTVLLSNNKSPRVEPFCRQVQSKCIPDGKKPSRKGYQKAMDLMSTTTTNTLFVGDQLFTDVYGAKRTGIYSILVSPIHPSEEIQIVLKRYLEKIVLFFYERKQRRGNSND